MRASFPRSDPQFVREVQPYLRHVPYLPEWATAYRNPSIVQHVLAGVIWILPPIGVVRILKIRGPREQTEELYYSSLTRTLTLYQRRLDELRLLPGLPLGLPNRDLDTGDWTKPGAYALTDRTYAKLLREITERAEPGATRAEAGHPELLCGAGCADLNEAPSGRLGASAEGPGATARHAGAPSIGGGEGVE